MRLTVMSVPYHLGRGGEGMALGPGRYLDGGLVAALEARGHETSVVHVERPSPFTDELAAVTAINRALAGAVREAVASGSFPLVAGGNCNVALGMTAGLGAPGTAVVWFDAHGDYNTPDTTPSGFLDGMPLAMAAGRAHAGAWAQPMGAVDPRAVVHVGGRALDQGEVDGFAADGVHVVTCAGLRGAGGLPAALAAAAAHAAQAYVHVDIDVLDLAVAPGVDFPTPGGLAPGEVVDAVAAVHRVLPIAGLSVTAFSPEREDGDTTLTTGIALMGRLADLVARG
jgi:arginase